MKANRYSETQRFDQWWLWLFVLLPLLGIFVWAFVQQILLGKPFGDNPGNNAELILSGVLPIGILLLFRGMRLDTKLSEEGVEVRFFPFVKKRTYAWQDIEKAYLRSYNSLMEFGGWGIRFAHSGTAYNVAGKYGLQLELRNGKRLLIGTQDPERLRRALANHSIPGA
ncbi:MAG: hypothetical protein ACOYOD_14305 [Saprospiraceae bacterium]